MKLLLGFLTFFALYTPVYADNCPGTTGGECDCIQCLCHGCKKHAVASLTPKDGGREAAKRLDSLGRGKPAVIFYGTAKPFDVPGAKVVYLKDHWKKDRVPAELRDGGIHACRSWGSDNPNDNGGFAPDALPSSVRNWLFPELLPMPVKVSYQPTDYFIQYSIPVVCFGGRG